MTPIGSLHERIGSGEHGAGWLTALGRAFISPVDLACAIVAALAETPAKDRASLTAEAAEICRIAANAVIENHLHGMDAAAKKALASLPAPGGQEESN